MPKHVHLIFYRRQPSYDIRVILQVIKEPVGKCAVGYLRKVAPHWLPKIAVRHGQRERYHYWQEGGGYDRNINELNTAVHDRLRGSESRSAWPGENDCGVAVVECGLV